jgi:hypothetical protein
MVYVLSSKSEGHRGAFSHTTGEQECGRTAASEARAFLINTSRGVLIHERALVEALNAGTMAGGRH